MNEITMNQQACRLDELQQLLETERCKPAKQRDYERIEQICSEIYELTSTAEQRANAETGKEALTAYMQRRRRCRIRQIQRFAVAAAACFAVLLGINRLSMRVCGAGLLRAVYEKIAGGVQFQPGNSAVSRSDTMREICSSCGFSPMLPSYLPVQFELAHTETDTNPYVNFCFQDGDARIALTIEQFPENQAEADIMAGFPSDQYQIHEAQQGGTEILTSWEESQFTAVFMQEHVLYTLFTEDVGQQESLKILNSFFA